MSGSAKVVTAANDLGEVERQVVSVRGKAGAIGAVGGGPGGCELANCGTERAQRRAAVGSRGQQCGSGSPEFEPVDPSECVQVDVVANACVSLTQLHCGAEFLGENRDNPIAEDLDGRSVEQGRQSDGCGTGGHGITEVHVQFELDPR